MVDAQGHVYFVYTNHGVMRIEPSGTLTNIHAEDKGGHWLALDARGAFAHVIPKEFQRITPEGAIPALIFANGGAPLVVGADGDLYYGSNGSQQDSFPPGALTVARLSPRGQKDLLAPALKDKLGELKDGITGLASGADGSIYVATWNGIVKLNADGSIAKVVHPVVVKDCDSDPADHNPANADSPLLRGLLPSSAEDHAGWDGDFHLEGGAALVSDGRGGERQRYLRPRIHQCQRSGDGRLAAAREEDCWR